MKKNIIKGTASGIVLSMLLTGCVSTSGQPKVPNKTIGKNKLYVSFDKDSKEIDGISNNKMKNGFSLNDYSPISYNYKIRKKLELVLIRAKPKDYYRSVECSDQIGWNTTMTLGLFIGTFGLTTLGGVVACDNIYYFDYKRFDEDVKSIVNNSDRKELISVFDNLKSTKHQSETTINNYISIVNNELNNQYLENNTALNNQYNTFYAKYKNSQPKLQIQTIDQSGLYKNEKLPVYINIVNNRLKKTNLISVSKIPNIRYDNKVNNTFPCTSINNCLKKITKSKDVILSQLEEDKIKIKQIKTKSLITKKEEFITKLKSSNSYLKKKTSFYTIKNNKPTVSKYFNSGIVRKTINYNVEVQNKINSNKKNIDAKIIVNNVDYTNIFPNFSNQNKDIKIVFDKSTKSYKLKNLTDTFVQIKSISLYYNDSIYNLTLSKDNNQYSVELSPQATKHISLYTSIKESNYRNLTKTKAKELFCKFGFAIKYTKGNQTKNITLYKEIKVNVYQLIKDIIND